VSSVVTQSFGLFASSFAKTCDDGNNGDNDSCPADCRIAACTPLTATQRFVQVHFQAPLGALVAGITVLADYPEGLVDLPGNGTTFPSGRFRFQEYPGASMNASDPFTNPVSGVRCFAVIE
jgi:hypothetical protein